MPLSRERALSSNTVRERARAPLTVVCVRREGRNDNGTRERDGPARGTSNAERDDECTTRSKHYGGSS